MNQLSVHADTEKRETGARLSFEQLVLRHLDGLYGLAYRLTGNRTAAEDLLQEACVKALEHFHALRREAKGKTWLFRILHNTFISQYRARSEAPPMVDVELDEIVSGETPDASGPDPFGYLFDDEVQAAFDALPVEFRTVIVLADIEECSYREIAEILEIPMGTVASRLYRGHGLLRETLKGYARKHGYMRCSNDV